MRLSPLLVQIGLLGNLGAILAGWLASSYFKDLEAWQWQQFKLSSFPRAKIVGRWCKYEGQVCVPEVQNK